MVMSDAGGQGGAYAIRSVERVVDILNLLAVAPGGASLGTVAEVTGLPRSSAFRYLATLEARGYVEKDGSEGTYRLGLGFPTVRAHLTDALVTTAKPYLERLSARFGETANLGMLDGERVAYLAIVESPRQVRLAARVGDRDPIHCTALGKAIAAGLPRADLERTIRVDHLPRRTRATITDPDRLFATLDEVARDGYALDDRENESDGRCVAMALPLQGVHAALSVSAPVGRLPLKLVPEVVEALRHAVDGIATDWDQHYPQVG